MAVSVPKLNRLDPAPAMPQNDRIRFQANDHASEIMQTTNAIVGVVDKVDQIHYEYENDAIDKLSQEHEQEYTAWNNQKLESLKNYEGDPTDAYVKYDEEAAAKKSEILSRREDLNERVKRHVGSRFEKTYANQNIVAMKQRGAQIEGYENKTFEASVGLKKNNLAVNAGYIQKDDDSSYLMFDQGLGEIRDTIVRQALKKGTAVKVEDENAPSNYAFRDDDGNVVRVNLTPLAQARIAKDTSEGVKNSIDVMINGGRLEEARQMQEKYKAYLDPVGGSKLQKKLQNADRKTEAYTFMAGIKNKSPEAQISAIDGLKDLELRSEVLKIKDSDDAKLQSMRTRKEKKNYETLADRVIEKMNSSEPYYGIADLENDPIFKATEGNLGAKQKKAIYEMVQTPKDTNPKSEARVQDLFLGNDPEKTIDKISAAEFQEYTVGLSKADKTKYTNMYNSLRINTASEERQMYKRAGTFLRDQFIVDGHITRDRFNRISGEDEKTLIKAQNKLMDIMSTQGTITNDKQLKDFVKDFSVAEIKGKVFNPEPKNAFRAKNDTTNTAKDIKISPEEITRLKRQFYRENKYFPTTSDEKFKNYVKQNISRT
jgi:hypothetical protein